MNTRKILLCDQLMAGQMVGNISYFFLAATSMTVQGNTQKIAAKFMVTSACTMNTVDIYLGITGTTTGITIKASIQTDSSDAPSGTIVGTQTAAFNCPASSGWTGSQSLPSTQPALTANTWYWLVLEDGGGTAPTGSNFYQFTNMGGTGGRFNRGKARQYNGTNWTTTAAYNGDCSWILADTNGVYNGVPYEGSFVNETSTPIYGTQRLGIKFRAGGRCQVYGAAFYIVVSGGGGPPSGLDVTLYQGSTVLETVTISEAYVATGSGSSLEVFFSQTYQITPGTDYYIGLHQNGGTGDASHYYISGKVPINPTYVSCSMPPGWDSLKGTSTNPTAWSSVVAGSREEYAIAPMILDCVTPFGSAEVSSASVG